MYLSQQLIFFLIILKTYNLLQLSELCLHAFYFFVIEEFEFRIDSCKTSLVCYRTHPATLLPR